MGLTQSLVQGWKERRRAKASVAPVTIYMAALVCLFRFVVILQRPNILPPDYWIS
jgi:hypothetical protein